MSKGIRSELMWFANQQEKKLSKRMASKVAWQKTGVRVLANRLLDEVEELVVEIKKGMEQTRQGSMPDTDSIIDECVDVANFAMMIADKAKWLEEAK